MGDRNYNIYIRSSSLDAVERGLTTVFERDGYHRIPKPSPQSLESYHRHHFYMQIHKDPRLDSWRAAALFPGAVGWTMMQTYPVDILCRPAVGAERPRLATLTMELGCDAFQLNLYDSDTLILLEANACGQIVFSGEGMVTPKEIEQLIPAEYRQEGFRLLPVAEELKAILEEDYAYIVDKVEVIAALLCGTSFAYWENNTGTLVFDPHGELGAPGARALYFQRHTGPYIDSSVGLAEGSYSSSTSSALKNL